MNRFITTFNNFKLAAIGALLVEFAAFMSFACYYVKSFPLCFVCSFLWGVSSTFLFSNTGALVATIFPGKI
jgi:MFS family permease